MTSNPTLTDRALPADSQGQSAPITRSAVLDWLDQARAAAQNSSLAERLAVDGIDVLDVLLEPLHLSLLAALREMSAPRPLSAYKRAFQRARALGYRVKRMYHERRVRMVSKKPTPHEILFWPREITHVDAQRPVLANLAARGADCGAVTSQPKTFDQLRDAGVDAVFTPAAWPKVVRAARRNGARQARLLAAGGALKLPPILLHDRSVDLEPIWRKSIVRLLPEVLEAVANASQTVERLGPRVLLIGNDLTLHGRAACRVAQNRGVPTAVLMHGSITGDLLHGRHIANAIFVYGEASRREMMARGGDGARVMACGAPYLDSRPQQTGQVDQRLCARLGLKSQERWILVATSGPGDRISRQHHQQVIESLRRLAAAIPQTHLVIKLHRKDRVAHYREALRGVGNNFHILPNGESGLPTSIFDWLQGCPLVLTGASSVAVEAMLMDVPVITMDFCGEISQVDFIDAGATLHVTTFAELNAAVRTVFESPDSLADIRACARHYLEGAFFRLDGRSAERIADAIESLARQMSRPN